MPTGPSVAKDVLESWSAVMNHILHCETERVKSSEALTEIARRSARRRLCRRRSLDPRSRPRRAAAAAARNQSTSNDPVQAIASIAEARHDVAVLVETFVERAEHNRDFAAGHRRFNSGNTLW